MTDTAATAAKDANRRSDNIGGIVVPPPPLVFDDGSRVMRESLPTTDQQQQQQQQQRDAAAGDLDDDCQLRRRTVLQSRRGSAPLHEYYEIDRISRDVLEACLTTTNDDGEDGGDGGGDHTRNGRQAMSHNHPHRPRILRVALQFPDELLIDSPDVCWLLDEKLREDLAQRMAPGVDAVVVDDDEGKLGNPCGGGSSRGGDAAAAASVGGSSSCCSVLPFCFVLGDTTANSCCPDEVAALHLNADVLVHYGHACLSPTASLPVLYSFGRRELDVTAAAQSLDDERRRRMLESASGSGGESGGSSSSSNKFLLLYQVGYHHAMKELQERWMALSSGGDTDLHVLIGEILTPKNNQQPTSSARRMVQPSSTCCSKTGDDCSSTDHHQECRDENTDEIQVDAARSTVDSTSSQQYNQNEIQSTKQIAQDDHTDSDIVHFRPLIVGGLELPKSIASWEQLSDFTVVFVMSDPDESTGGNGPPNRQYVNSMMCLLSLPHPPRGGYWIYAPDQNSLRTDIGPPPAVQRQLKRRFFLTQRARDARVFGILVSNLSQQHLVQVVRALHAIVRDAGKASYTFAVGKVNPAKLSNFAEIECFCLVACREHSLLDEEREYPVPVITPMELEMALGAGNLQWGELAYSLDCQDVMVRRQEQVEESEFATNVDGGHDRATPNGDNDADAPYFSLVTGRYVARQPTEPSASAPTDLDLRNLPGKGQVTEYTSEAADFLKLRQYQGLESLVGQTEAKAAVQGLKGIASVYTGTDVPAI